MPNHSSRILTEPSNWDRQLAAHRGMSATEREALDKLRKHGSFFRMWGGQWTYSGCPLKKIKHGAHVVYEAPAWWRTTPTIRALIVNGHAKCDGDIVEYASRVEAGVTESA